MALPAENLMFPFVGHPGVSLASVRKALLLRVSRGLLFEISDKSKKKMRPLKKEPHNLIKKIEEKTLGHELI
jgi:hypothetical protein